MSAVDVFSILIALVLLVIVPLIWLIIAMIRYTKKSPNLVKPEMILRVITQIIGFFVVGVYAVVISQSNIVKALGTLYCLTYGILGITYLIIDSKSAKQETKYNIELALLTLTSMAASASIFAGLAILFYSTAQSAPAPTSNPLYTEGAGPAPAVPEAPPPTRGNALLRQANQA